MSQLSVSATAYAPVPPAKNSTLENLTDAEKKDPAFLAMIIQRLDGEINSVKSMYKDVTKNYQNEVQDLQEKHESSQETNSELREWRDKMRVNMSRMRTKIITLESDHKTEIINRQKAFDEKCDELIKTHRRHNQIMRDLDQEKQRSLETERRYGRAQQELESRVRDLQDSLNRERENSSGEIWMKNSVRLKWIIDEMEKVGAIRLPDHEWAIDMARDIEYNRDDRPEYSSFRNDMPYEIYRSALPNSADANMEFISEEEEERRIQMLSQEASNFSNNVSEHLFSLIENDRENTIAKIILIQNFFRKKREQRGIIYTQILGMNIGTNSIIRIQRIFRGFRSRGIRFYASQKRIGSNYYYAIAWLRQLRFSRTGVTTYPIVDGSVPLRPSFLYSTSNAALRDMGISLNHLKRSIVLENSSFDHAYSYQWLNNSGDLRGRVTTIPPHSNYRLSTYVGHWFQITNLTTKNVAFIRINYSTKNNDRFDMRNGITHREENTHFILGDYIPRFQRPKPIIDSITDSVKNWFQENYSENPDVQRIINGGSCDCERCEVIRNLFGVRRNQSQNIRNIPVIRNRPETDNRIIINRNREINWNDFINDDDDERFMIAIQRSLEDVSPTIDEDDYSDTFANIFNEQISLTDDLEDFNINTMFQENMIQEPDEFTLQRQQQDEEYQRALAEDEARNTLEGDVDTEAVRQARIARFS
tara:strand:+ start:1057 stop:3168 length:2112 start_codon:yes stop_codon:yes gene_type:complete